jgi:hypothetical protein
MHTEVITLDRGEADRLYRKYKEHAAYSEPVDWEIQRTFDLLRKGKTVIRAIESIKQAGLNREFLPKLALGPAIAKEVHITRYHDGQMAMRPLMPGKRWPHSGAGSYAFRQNTFRFPAESFPMTWDNKHRTGSSAHKTLMPLIPLHLRPKRGLQNYSVLFEAEWEPLPPRDPYLLRRIGKADLWLVVASWALSEIELAALATRV